MIWWHVVDGVAIGYPDTRETHALVDASPRGWFGTIEGAILHGGVLATAFERKTEMTYDAARWLATNGRERVPMGEITTTKITAECRDDYEQALDALRAEMDRRD
jgi:hypothetical protein